VAKAKPKTAAKNRASKPAPKIAKKAVVKKAVAPKPKARSAAKLFASRALARLKTPGMNLSDREFLAPALEILETPPSPVHVAFLWIICAFVVTAALAFVFIAAGSSVVLGLLQGWAPEWLIRAVTQMSFLGHFGAITRGVIDLRDVVYFLSIMIAFLGANAILVDLEKAE